jgi:hypothetical protein
METPMVTSRNKFYVVNHNGECKPKTAKSTAILMPLSAKQSMPLYMLLTSIRAWGTPQVIVQGMARTPIPRQADLAASLGA